jgi:hypothetical protein
VTLPDGTEPLVRGGKKTTWRTPVDERTGEALAR